MRIEDLRGKNWRENERLTYIAKRGEILTEEYEAQVREIIKLVREKGDEAIAELTKRFEGRDITPDAFELTEEELENAYEETEEEVKEALEIACERIRNFHEKQLEKSYIKEEEGIILGQRVIPLERVGVYVPGGKASYPSTVLMNVVPAKVAGVESVIMVTPYPNRYTLAAAYIAGVDRVFQIGGAQAIAGLAFGTNVIPKVDKIVGPGNIYVALAKKLLFGIIDIDMIAGPSEILIIADSSADPSWLAVDLLSQAEHDELAGAFMLTTDYDIAKATANNVKNMLKELSRKEIAKESLSRFGTIFIAEDLKRACEIANFIAPEHLEIVTEDPFSLLPYIKHAGAVFLGKYTTESLGDYILGPNHTLPTGGTSRFFSPLGVYDFVKRSSVLYTSEEGFKRVSDLAETLAKIEGLEAHYLASYIRRKGS